jgi:hypothetical protein
MAFTSWEAASHAASVATYNATVSHLNSISSAYNVLLNASTSFFNDAAKFQTRAKALSIAEVYAASIALSSKSKKNVKLGIAKVEAAKARLTAVEYYVVYLPIILFAEGRPTGYYEVIGGVGYDKNYAQAVAWAQSQANSLSGYSSWSFSLSFSTSGGTFIIDAGTVASLLNITLAVANNVGLISDKTYREINSNPLWQIGINVVASELLSYGMGSFGGVNTPLGYMDAKSAADMASSGATSLLETLAAAQSAYSLYKTYTSSKQENQTVEQKAQEQAKEFHDIATLASGEYYKVFAGQKFFNIALPGHDGYVPASVQTPSWGIVGEKAHSEDAFMANIMSQNRNATMAGGAGYLNSITEGAIPLNT